VESISKVGAPIGQMLLPCNDRWIMRLIVSRGDLQLDSNNWGGGVGIAHILKDVSLVEAKVLVCVRKLCTDVSED
jgi:hypothetical protein